VGQEDSDPVNNEGLEYRAHIAQFGWADTVHDGQIAGSVGQALRLEALQIVPPAGWVLNVRVHIANEG
jgi:hypothetical protein